MSANNVLVTGAAGFIGSHATEALVAGPATRVIGLDNFDDYYSPKLKRARLKNVPPSGKFDFVELDIRDTDRLQSMFDRLDIDTVVHLAARPGVRASSNTPAETVSNNVNGFLSVLEACRHHDVEHLVFASSSSVYGTDTDPSSEDQQIRQPNSLYAATKVSKEAMAHSYAHQYGIPTTGVRFFTVYGPWGRPDMAYHLFADAIWRGESIDLFNYGEMHRDFTYIDDAVEGLMRLVETPPNDPGRENASSSEPIAPDTPYRVRNIGHSDPVGLSEFVSEIERAMGQTADKNLVAMPPGDVETTHADTTQFENQFGKLPKTELREGIQCFANWFREYYDLD